MAKGERKVQIDKYIIDDSDSDDELLHLPMMN
jgi:hypothetical protein